MAITTSQIPALLLPGVRQIKGLYREMDTQWTKIYAKGPSNMEAERTVHVRYLPLPQLKLAGTPTQFDNLAGQRFTWNHLHVVFSLGYAFTEEALDDNLYKSAFDAANLGLARSFRQMKEINAAAPLNTGNVLNATIGGDNLPLFATNHPVDGYQVPNTPAVQVGLNENSLILANNMIRRFRDEAGLLFGSQGKKLVVPSLRHVAKPHGDATATRLHGQRHLVGQGERRSPRWLRGSGLPDLPYACSCCPMGGLDLSRPQTVPDRDSDFRPITSWSRARSVITSAGMTGDVVWGIPDELRNSQMATSQLDGPLHVSGSMQGFPASAFGSPVPDPNQDAGPSVLYQGISVPDCRVVYLKDKVNGYTGVVQSFQVQSNLKSISQIPATLVPPTSRLAGHHVGHGLTLAAGLWASPQRTDPSLGAALMGAAPVVAGAVLTLVSPSATARPGPLRSRCLTATCSAWVCRW
jgi:hypothetical protein